MNSIVILKPHNLTLFIDNYCLLNYNMIGQTHTGTVAIFDSVTEGVNKSGIKAVNSKNADLGFRISINFVSINIL